MIDLNKPTTNCDIGTIRSLLISEFMIRNSDKSILTKKFPKVYIPIDKMEELGYILIDSGMIVKQFEWYMFAWNDSAFVTFQQNSYGLHDCQIFFSDKASLDTILGLISKVDPKQNQIQINWYYGDDYEEIIDVSNTVVKDCLFPFIESGVNNFIQDFLNSKENILILVGPPGTGKTTFIREILYTIGKEVYLSYDMNVLMKDYVFASFVSDMDAGCFVVEDADVLMKKRKDGNNNMAKFLNVGDGLITIDKKMIFSTNIENINDVDPAIMRPGRCYDVVKFRVLGFEEAKDVVKEYGLPPIEVKQSYTLGEIFNRKRKAVKQSFGFIG